MDFTRPIAPYAHMMQIPPSGAAHIHEMWRNVKPLRVSPPLQQGSVCARRLGVGGVRYVQESLHFTSSVEGV